MHGQVFSYNGLKFWCIYRLQLKTNFREIHENKYTAKKSTIAVSNNIKTDIYLPNFDIWELHSPYL